MHRLCKNEQGLTLLELLAAVVLVATLAIVFTGAGTAYFSWHTQDRHRDEAVLLAEQKLDDAKHTIESGNTLSLAQLKGTTSNQYSWSIAINPHTLDGNANADLTDITVTISYPPQGSTEMPTVVLKTVARKRATT